LLATVFVGACSSPSPPLRNPEAEQVAHERELELMRIKLVGPTWGLVQIHWMGGGATVPSQPEWYTLQFSDDGQVQVRADCNRGHGAWTTTGRGKLQLGPLAVTRAFCGDDPVNQRFLPDLEKVRSVEFTETRMRLIAPVDDVVLEFEPLSAGD
jgi:heat shock protein HslJ